MSLEDYEGIPFTVIEYRGRLHIFLSIMDDISLTSFDHRNPYKALTGILEGHIFALEYIWWTPILHEGRMTFIRLSPC